MALRKFDINLDDATYQAALTRSQREGKTLDQVLTEFVTTYAETEVVEDEKPVSEEPTTYTVKPGDTLSKIARMFYGDARKYTIIQQANNITEPRDLWVGKVLVIPPIEGGPPPPPPSPPEAPSEEPTPPAPEPEADPCAPIAGESYGTLPIVGPPTDRPAAEHGDLNLALRGYSRAQATRGLIDMAGPTDHRAPQLAGLFADNRTPDFTSVYRVNNWDWGRNARSAPIGEFEVTLAGLAAEAGETIHVPDSGYGIGQGYAVLVLYADTDHITLKYTGEDSVVNGYTVHVEGVCVEPNLLALYERMNADGRGQLPALRAGQAFGRARENEIQVAIRDTGRFMDPRTRKDWWRGR